MLYARHYAVCSAHRTFAISLTTLRGRGYCYPIFQVGKLRLRGIGLSCACAADTGLKACLSDLRPHHLLSTVRPLPGTTPDLVLTTH